MEIENQAFARIMYAKQLIEKQSQGVALTAEEQIIVDSLTEDDFRILKVALELPKGEELISIVGNFIVELADAQTSYEQGKKLTDDQVDYLAKAPRELLIIARCKKLEARLARFKDGVKVMGLGLTGISSYTNLKNNLRRMSDMAAQSMVEMNSELRMMLDFVEQEVGEDKIERFKAYPDDENKLEESSAELAGLMLRFEFGQELSDEELKKLAPAYGNKSARHIMDKDYIRRLNLPDSSVSNYMDNTSRIAQKRKEYESTDEIIELTKKHGLPFYVKCRPTA